MRTPLNYTGNKSRLVEKFNSEFPENLNVFVDLFCGGGSVGLSVNAKKVIFIDNNKNVISLLEHLAKYEYETLLDRLETLTKKYCLSYSAKYGYQKYRVGIEKGDNNGLKQFNSIGFYKLRNDYNKSKDKFSSRSLDMLYLLVVYGFNNDMRFNRHGDYNLPIGKTDLNSSNLKKIKNYIERINKIDYEFLCGDFRDKKIKEKILFADFVYADPPYLLGNAVYNENGNWGEEIENKLINFLQELNKSGKHFALSNVLEKQNPNKTNELLSSWILKHSNLNIVDIKQHYRSSSYNKKNRNSEEREVLITNFTQYA